VYRDASGITQIYADTPHDLFLAQGYVHAQDRMWQMEVWRHISSGRLAELFGESQVKTDKFIRLLGFRRAAQADLEAASPGVRAASGGCRAADGGRYGRVRLGVAPRHEP